jgi:hypothetical protein
MKSMQEKIGSLCHRRHPQRQAQAKSRKGKADGISVVGDGNSQAPMDGQLGLQVEFGSNAKLKVQLERRRQIEPNLVVAYTASSSGSVFAVFVDGVGMRLHSFST